MRKKFHLTMARLFLKGYRYLKTYGELVFGRRPRTPAEVIDYCVDRPVMMAQVRSEIEELGNLIQAAAPKRSLEIGTNYGGTLFLLCTLSPPGARVISVDLPAGQFGGGYPRRKMPLYRSFPRNGQQLHLIRGDSHAPETLARVERLLGGNKLDYLFIDGDHTYEGVKRDFEMYSRLVRSGGMIAFHDIAVHTTEKSCEVDRFWNEIKQRFRHREFVENPNQGWAGIGVLFVS
jgi:predicted O-methyltransferase YrrM